MTTTSIKQGEFWVLHTELGCDSTIHRARYLTDAECAAKGLADWCYGYMMVAIGDSISVPHINWGSVATLGIRKSDGTFMGAGGTTMATIITDAEREMLIAVNAGREAAKIAQEKQETIASLQKEIACAEKQRTIYATPEEAKSAAKRYNEIHNEGGEGYVPHFYHKAEVESMKARLAEMVA